MTCINDDDDDYGEEVGTSTGEDGWRPFDDDDFDEDDEEDASKDSFEVKDCSFF